MKSGTSDQSISKKVERVEEIIDRLENDDEEIALTTARELYEEGEELISEIEEELALDEGELEEVSA